MGESKEEQIQRLLQEGLDHYGMDDIAAAILTWERVLELDPNHVEALDFIKTADRRSRPRPPKQKKRQAAAAAVLEESRELIRREDYGGALALLRSAGDRCSPSLEYEATVELVRSRLFQRYRERVVDLQRVPVVGSDASAQSGLNLPPDAGFLISMMDGMTSLADVISLAGMDAFEALHILDSLMEAGVLELRE